MPHCPSAAELSSTLPAHAHGPTGVCPQRFPDSGQPRPAHTGALRGQPAAWLPLWPHPASPSRTYAGKAFEPSPLTWQSPEGWFKCFLNAFMNRHCGERSVTPQRPSPMLLTGCWESLEEVTEKCWRSHRSCSMWWLRFKAPASRQSSPTAKPPFNCLWRRWCFYIFIYHVSFPPV